MKKIDKVKQQEFQHAVFNWLAAEQSIESELFIVEYLVNKL